MNLENREPPSDQFPHTVVGDETVFPTVMTVGTRVAHHGDSAQFTRLMMIAVRVKNACDAAEATAETRDARERVKGEFAAIESLTDDQREMLEQALY